jgi:hypothetical protein
MTKRILTSLFLALSLVAVGAAGASAQDRCDHRGARGESAARSRGHGPTKNATAARHARAGRTEGARGPRAMLGMKARLGLSDAQVAGIRAVMASERARRKTARAAQPNVQPTPAVRAAHRVQMQAQIAAILTPAQRVAFRQAIAARAERRPAATVTRPNARRAPAAVRARVRARPSR